MNILITENLRKKLKRRANRFTKIEPTDINTFHSKVLLFWNFFSQQPTFLGIAEYLLPRFPNISQDVDKIFSTNQCVSHISDEHAAALGYKVIQRLAEGKDDISLLEKSSFAALHRKSKTQGLYEFYIEPLCNYIDEELTNQSVMLTLLTRYKQRSEWFYRKQLYDEKIQACSDPKKRQEIETPLALNLYAYLYDQGIDFHLGPSSMPGKIDLIAAQDTSDPLLLDVKVFDNKDRDKSYLCRGFNQVYRYTQDYNEPLGYMVIFNVTDQSLKFTLKCSSYIPMVLYNNKTIFLLTIDIKYPPVLPSKSGRSTPIEIKEEDLIRIQ